MSALRCDQCGRFCSHLNDVWDSAAMQIVYEVCDDCQAEREQR